MCSSEYAHDAAQNSPQNLISSNMSSSPLNFIPHAFNDVFFTVSFTNCLSLCLSNHWQYLQSAAWVAAISRAVTNISDEWNILLSRCGASPAIPSVFCIGWMLIVDILEAFFSALCGHLRMLVLYLPFVFCWQGVVCVFFVQLRSYWCTVLYNTNLAAMVDHSKTWRCCNEFNVNSR